MFFNPFSPLPAVAAAHRPEPRAARIPLGLYAYGSPSKPVGKTTLTLSGSTADKSPNLAATCIIDAWSTLKLKLTPAKAKVDEVELEQVFDVEPSDDGVAPPRPLWRTPRQVKTVLKYAPAGDTLSVRYQVAVGAAKSGAVRGQTVAVEAAFANFLATNIKRHREKYFAECGVGEKVTLAGEFDQAKKQVGLTAKGKIDARSEGTLKIVLGSGKNLPINASVKFKADNDNTVTVGADVSTQKAKISWDRKIANGTLTVTTGFPVNDPKKANLVLSGKYNLDLDLSSISF